jgi:hypothetical protein
LRFTAAEDPGTERVWRTRWIPADLPPAARERVVRREDKPPDLVVVMPVKDWKCAECERDGDLLIMDNAGPLCLTCAEDARMRRRERDGERRAREDVELQATMAGEITRLFPRCPPERAGAVARHTARRGSGRVGRSAAGRALDEEALTLAVVASIRHEDTGYDDLLMSGVPREEARDRIRPAIDRILATWA